MTQTEMIEQAWQAVQDNKISFTDYDALLTALTHHQQVSYREYIMSPEWKARADAAKARSFHRCQLCNRGRNEGVRLNAHHRTYDRLGHELPEDITVLCEDCHAIFHGKV